MRLYVTRSDLRKEVYIRSGNVTSASQTVQLEERVNYLLNYWQRHLAKKHQWPWLTLNIELNVAANSNTAPIFGDPQFSKQRSRIFVELYAVTYAGVVFVIQRAAQRKHGLRRLQLRLEHAADQHLLDGGKHLTHPLFRRRVAHKVGKNLVDHGGSACARFIRQPIDFLHDFVRQNERIHAFVHLYHLTV